MGVNMSGNKNSHFFAMISRMKYINRWSLMRNTRSENLSEHSMEVACVAHALVLLRNRRFGGSLNAERAAEEAREVRVGVTEARRPGEVREAIVFVEEPSDLAASPQEFFASMEPFAAHAGGADYSREALYRVGQVPRT